MFCFQCRVGQRWKAQCLQQGQTHWQLLILLLKLCFSFNLRNAFNVFLLIPIHSRHDLLSLPTVFEVLEPCRESIVFYLSTNGVSLHLPWLVGLVNKSVKSTPVFTKHVFRPPQRDEKRPFRTQWVGNYFSHSAFFKKKKSISQLSFLSGYYSGQEITLFLH